MEVVNGRTWQSDKEKFFKKHGADYTVDTSAFENGSYVKTYTFEDGAEFYESSRYVWENGIVNVKNIAFYQSVKLFKTEYWSTESETKCFYERA